MGTLRINGDTSGYVDITVPAVAGNTTMNIASPTFSGNVGIGTTSPQKSLDVVGSLRFASTATAGYSLIEYGRSSTSSNNWHVGSEGDGTFRWYSGNLGSGTERMRIDSAGRITAPYQTSCIAYLGSDQSISANTWTKVNLNQTTFNVGNNFNTSNGRFVAPVAGRYFVGYTVNFNSGGFSGYLYSGILINGSFTFYGEGRNSSASWNGDNTLGNGQLVNLTANDFVELYAYSAGTNSLASGTLRTHLSAHLLS